MNILRKGISSVATLKALVLQVSNFQKTTFRGIMRAKYVEVESGRRFSSTYLVLFICELYQHIDRHYFQIPPICRTM